MNSKISIVVVCALMFFGVRAIIDETMAVLHSNYRFLHGLPAKLAGWSYLAAAAYILCTHSTLALKIEIPEKISGVIAIVGAGLFLAAMYIQVKNVLPSPRP